MLTNCVRAIPGRFSFLEARDVIAASELERELKVLRGLADRLMPPLNQRPHIFHEQKDALTRGIEALMARCGFGVPKSPRSFCAEQRDTGAARIAVKGRAIPIERRRSRGM